MRLVSLILAACAVAAIPAGAAGAIDTSSQRTAVTADGVVLNTTVALATARRKPPRRLKSSGPAHERGTRPLPLEPDYYRRQLPPRPDGYRPPQSDIGHLPYEYRMPR
jgi:hypothetical protein